MDKPWSQYFCCTLAANRELGCRSNPVAAKRALRAILKATDICANEPERAAQHMVDGGFTANYDYALQTMKDVPYNRWREYDPEDTVRFFALRLHEIGMIKSSPEQIISQGTNWRFFNELKQELKGLRGGTDWIAGPIDASSCAEQGRSVCPPPGCCCLVAAIVQRGRCPVRRCRPRSPRSGSRTVGAPVRLPSTWPRISCTAKASPTSSTFS